MTLRVAVVGAGFIGADHAAAYAAQPDAEIVAIVDPDSGRGGALAARHGASAVPDLEALLVSARPDAASVCVPTGLHRPVVERLAAAGVHILLEKPMAATVADCDAIAEAAEAAGIVLMLGLTHRFHEELIEARRLIASGAIGLPRLALDAFSFGEHGPWPAWYYDRTLSGGGELMHDGVHLVDRLEWLIDSPIVEVYGRTTSYARSIEGVEDGGVAILSFANGAIGSIFVNESTYPLRSDAESVPMPGRLELEIHGTRGSIRYRTWHELVVDLAGEPSRTVTRTDDGEMSREIRAFLDAIAAGTPPPVGAREGRRGIAIIGAIYESERRGRPVSVDELFPRPS
ncbi:MAG TPA: Gfo/Idh/MocA family oxidoreductase [Candidatus Limnocylindrales bacterium]|nr:Gfo/Idh/MocA family oxidoreductase [Candidatus Limnocylindrales bacterium]